MEVEVIETVELAVDVETAEDIDAAIEKAFSEGSCRGIGCAACLGCNMDCSMCNLGTESVDGLESFDQTEEDSLFLSNENELCELEGSSSSDVEVTGTEVESSAEILRQPSYRELLADEAVPIVLARPLQKAKIESVEKAPAETFESKDVEPISSEETTDATSVSNGFSKKENLVVKKDSVFVEKKDIVELEPDEKIEVEDEATFRREVFEIEEIETDLLEPIVVDDEARVQDEETVFTKAEVEQIMFAKKSPLDLAGGESQVVFDNEESDLLSAAVEKPIKEAGAFEDYDEEPSKEIEEAPRVEEDSLEAISEEIELDGYDLIEEVFVDIKRPEEKASDSRAIFIEDIPIEINDLDGAYDEDVAVQNTSRRMVVSSCSNKKFELNFSLIRKMADLALCRMA